MKNCKTLHKTQIASCLKETIQTPPPPPPPPPPQPIPIRLNLTASLEQKFLAEIYRNTQTLAFKGLQECRMQKWCSTNVFSDKKQKHVCWKICKVRKGTSANHGGRHFYSALPLPSTIKKVPTALL